MHMFSYTFHLHILTHENLTVQTLGDMFHGKSYLGMHFFIEKLYVANFNLYQQRPPWQVLFYLNSHFQDHL